MSLSITDTFAKGGIHLISNQTPLVLRVTLYNTTPIAISGDVQVTLTGQAPTEDTNAYIFDMAYVDTLTLGSDQYHHFKLNITAIIRGICNDPQFKAEAAAEVHKQESRMASKILMTVSSPGETSRNWTNFYIHGFNQVNNSDSACMVEFANPGSPKDGIIPIVPGAPMIFYGWVPTTGTGLNVDGLLYKGTTLLHTIGLGASPIESLYSLYHPAGLNAYIYNASDDGVELFSLKINEITGSTDYFDLTMVAFKKACEGDVVLAWLNRYGVYSYMAFERYPTHTRNQKYIGGYNIEIDDVADVQSRKKSRGYENVRTVITAVAKSIPTQYFSAIEDLFYSMDVYYFTGTLPKDEFDIEDWLRVTVRGSLVERKKNSFENVRVDIMLPEKYTQLR